MKKQKQEKKDKFEALPDEWREAVNGAKDVSDIKSMAAKIAIDTQQILEAQSEDLDLKEKKDQVKIANAVYKDGIKENRLKMGYINMVLRNRGAI